MNAHDAPDGLAILRQLFGDNRAEWPSTHFRELFVAPTYLTKLESMRPCFLVGGRGTGKTTSLQSLRYDSTFQRLEAQGLTFSDQDYLGILIRMNKNRVRAFQGGELSEERWGRLFAHYVNLLVCLEFTFLTRWLEAHCDDSLTPTSIERVAHDLGLSRVGSLEQLEIETRRAVSDLQLQVNNPSRDLGLVLSIAEAPLRTFVEVLRDEGLIGSRVLFCCIDEYENLLDYQQAILNTYIKHAEPPLSYKVGVRKNGLRNRQTLDGQDLLKTPDDYAEIEIAEEGFDYFAKAVGELRLQYARRNGIDVPEALSSFLEELSLVEEAGLLGAKKIASEVLAELKSEGPGGAHQFMAGKTLAEIAFLRYWQQTEPRKVIELANDWRESDKAWANRFGNYAFASLFWMSKGAKGLRIRKYYCGERVILSLAGGNIRYFLELLDTAIGYQLDEDSSFAGTLVLSAKAQTLAARDVGKRRLNQLEGLADNGPQLKRLVLAVGKVFFELARSPAGHAPEVTSFVLSGSPADVARAHQLLSEGVAHLAFEVDPRTKATTSLEMKDDEYRLHRIFCAFFEISHRKKRRMTFEARDLLAVLDERPAQAISALLGEQPQSEGDSLPEQLAFFSPFYEGAKEN